MPTPLNQAPAGLLDLLNAQTLGEQPNILLDQVVGTLDLTNFYLRQKLEYANGTGNLQNGTNSITADPVPDSEFWIVQQASVNIDTIAGLNGSLSGHLCIFHSAGAIGGFEVGVTPDLTIDSNADEVNYRLTQIINYPLIMLPGDRFRFVINQNGIASGSAALTMQWQYLPLKVSN